MMAGPETPSATRVCRPAVDHDLGGGYRGAEMTVFDAEVVIRHTRYADQESGFAVLDAETDGRHVVLVGPLVHLEERERARVLGQWVQDRRYGEQVRGRRGAAAATVRRGDPDRRTCDGSGTSAASAPRRSSITTAPPACSTRSTGTRRRRCARPG